MVITTMINLNSYSDKERVDFWLNIQPGDIVSLSDTKTLSRSQERGLGFQPLEYQVEQVTTLSEINDLAQWKAINLFDVHDQVRMWVKIVGEIVEIRIGWEADPVDYQPGDRQDMVDRGWDWMFSETSVNLYSDNQNVNELMFSEAIQSVLPMGDGTKKPFVFYKKGNMDLQCSVTELPYSEMDDLVEDLIGTIGEYSCSDENCPFPELVIFEVGTVEEDDQPQRGGLIRILNAYELNFLNIDVLKQQEGEN